MKFKVGSRVHYRAYPSGMPVTDVAGTVVDIGRYRYDDPRKRGRVIYSVEWDDVDYDGNRKLRATNYEASDLARIACDACGADAGESCRPDCVGAAAYKDSL